MTDEPPRDRRDTEADTGSEAELENTEMEPGRSGTPPHPSPADGGEIEGSPRPPRPSQAEGERHMDGE